MLICSTIAVLVLLAPSSATKSAILLEGVGGSQLFTPDSYGGQVTNISFGLSNCAYSSTVTLDGIIYFIGGDNCLGANYGSKSTVSFKPWSNETTQLADTNFLRTEAIAAALPKEGAIVVCGSGNNNGQQTHTCEKYAAFLNEWTFIESLPLDANVLNYYGSAAVTLQDVVYVFGGAMTLGCDSQLVSDKVFKLGADGRWAQLGRMPAALVFHSAVALTDQSAMICGGVAANHLPTANCYTYSAIDDHWTAGMSLTRPGFGHTLLHYNDRLWCMGGDNSTGLESVMVYEQFTGWHDLPANYHLNNKMFQSIATITL